MIKTHDRQGILDYFKKLGMEIRTIEFQGGYVDNYIYNFKQAKIRHKKK